MTVSDRFSAQAELANWKRLLPTSSMVFLVGCFGIAMGHWIIGILGALAGGNTAVQYCLLYRKIQKSAEFRP